MIYQNKTKSFKSDTRNDCVESPESTVAKLLGIWKCFHTCLAELKCQMAAGGGVRILKKTMQNRREYIKEEQHRMVTIVC